MLNYVGLFTLRAGRFLGIRTGPAVVFSPMERTSEEDIELDRLWRLTFNQPLPMLGAPDIAWEILNEQLGKSVPGNGNAPRS